MRAGVSSSGCFSLTLNIFKNVRGVCISKINSSNADTLVRDFINGCRDWTGSADTSYGRQAKRGGQREGRTMPGPQPKYQPTFQPKQLEHARDLVRQRTSPHAQAQRARLAMLLAENPRLPNPEAAKLLGVHENTVRYWRKRWVDEGFRLEDKPRPGRSGVR